MRVWIGCLACYNEGRLVGDWYDADGSATDVEVEEIHRQGGAPDADPTHEELWVFDVDEAPHPSLHREMSPMEAGEIGDLLAELERQHIDVAAFAAYCNYTGEDFEEDSISGFEEAFCGEWNDRIEYAQDLADQMGSVPDDLPWPLSYIDWERAARDLFMDYFDVDSPGGIYVFRSY